MNGGRTRIVFAANRYGFLSRTQVRVKGRQSESETFPNRKEATDWAASIESAIRAGRHFPHAQSRRTSFDALAAEYVATVLAEFDDAQRVTRTQQLTWWSMRFKGLSLAEKITADRVLLARDACAAETFSRGKARPDKKTGEFIQPKAFKRSGATGNRYIAALSHLLVSRSRSDASSIEIRSATLVARKSLADGHDSCPTTNARNY